AKRLATSFTPGTSISTYSSKLSISLENAFQGIQVAFQIMMDRAMEDLGAGRGAMYLEIAKDRLENRFKDLLQPSEKREITRSEFTKGGGKHLDYFLKGKDASKRIVKFHFYNLEMSKDDANEKSLFYGRIFEIRSMQIKFLESLYGLEKDEGGKVTDEAKENAQIIARMHGIGVLMDILGANLYPFLKGTMRLESDDDWREFLLQKFEARRIKYGNNEKALTSTIKFLETFLKDFTTHTPYNIDDFGDNLLTKTFPRAMTGQLIHDCGVYALRIAYMLSLIRDHKDLRLEFKFIVLPTQVGLIITGKGLPLYITHNDEIRVYPSEDVKELKEKWVKVYEKGDPRVPTGKEDEDQFLAELAAREFISATDVPYALLEVPETKGKEADIKKKLWSFYRRRVATTELFSPEVFNPKSPHYQFHLRYLEVLDMIKEHHNTFLLPFWNVYAPEDWRLHEAVLSAAAEKMKRAKVGKDKDETMKEYEDKVARYEAIVGKKFDKVDKEFVPIEVKKIEITNYLNNNAEVIRKGISIASSDRLTSIETDPWWKRDFDDHMKELKDVNKPNIDAPFGKDEDILQPID
ncbi:MAG TPA: hypothetical protein VGE97_05230, partial [Nitrososphaera sp.]